MPDKLSDKLSYTSAGMFPWKILKQLDLLEGMRDTRRIIPVHAQLLPTNRCNMHCPMCSCRGRSAKLEMSLEDARKIIGSLGRLGCKAVTITGGGEPLMHPNFGDIVGMFAIHHIRQGLVTNGLLLSNVPSDTLREFTWIRVSNDDSRNLGGSYAVKLAAAIRRAPDVDWAFSHVVEQEPNLDEIQRVVKFANAHSFTHEVFSALIDDQ